MICPVCNRYCSALVLNPTKVNARRHSYKMVEKGKKSDYCCSRCEFKALAKKLRNIQKRTNALIIKSIPIALVNNL